MGFYGAIERAAGKRLKVSQWETWGATEAAEATVEQMRERSVQASGIAGTPTPDIYEVVIQA